MPSDEEIERVLAKHGASKKGMKELAFAKILLDIKIDLLKLSESPRYTSLVKSTLPLALKLQ